MEETILKTKHKQAYDTEEHWKTNNPVLLAGQLAYSSDNYGKYKIGDGISHWNELDYCNEKIFTGTLAQYTEANNNGEIKPGTIVNIVDDNDYNDQTVDAELSSTSENPVQNKVVTDELGGKLAKEDYDRTFLGAQRITSEGWYKIAKLYYAYIEIESCVIDIRKTNRSTPSETKLINLSATFQEPSFSTIFSKSGNKQYIDKIRMIQNADNGESCYIEIHCKSGIDDTVLVWLNGNSKETSWEKKWKPIEYVKDEEVPQSGEVAGLFEIPANFDPSYLVEKSKIANATSITEEGFVVDARQLNKEVQGSYAAGVAEEISGINAGLADNRKFLLPYAVEGTQTDTTAVDLSNPWGHNNRVCYVEKGISGSLPSDCQRGVRETFFCKDNSAVIKITGFDSDGNPAVWTARFNGTTWSPGWAKFVSSTGNAVVSHKISEITHSSKISINTGCSDTVGCILDSAVMLTVYFVVTEQINQGESIFTLPPIYWPNKIIAISFTENGPSGRYYGGISSRGAVYPDMDIPQGVIIRLAVSYFKS